MMKRKSVEYKPAWLRVFAPAGNLANLVPMVCEGCGRWVISQRLGVWDTYDAGIISGDDLTVAIILDRRLTRIKWNTAFNQPTLIDVCGVHGLSADGQYLAEHVCGLGRISDKPFIPPRKERPPGKPMFQAKLSKSEIEEFTRLWTMPLGELRKRKAPTGGIEAIVQQQLF